MSAEVLVKVEGASKKFCRSLKKSLWYGVQDIAHDLNPFGNGKADIRSLASENKSQKPELSPEHLFPNPDAGLRPGEFWAVNDVSFELRRGECLGLIGRNGAGKTTLLKMLNGLIKPDGGRIEMRGRIGALIALGAGFNPILTGRENIYVNGSVLGLTKREIDASIEDIIEFADIGDFIDTPVQSYSSGMQVRLGFAIATALSPDVLILDEVLAVGDANFRTKCFVRISALLRKAAVIFVSHSEEQLSRICTTSMLLEHGKVSYSGELKTCLTIYREKQPANVSTFISYHDEAVLQAELKVCAEEHSSGEDLPFEIHYSLSHPVQLSLHILSLIDESGVAIAVCDLLPLFKDIEIGTDLKRGVIKALSLKSGIYTFGLEATSVRHSAVIVRKVFEKRLRVNSSISCWCSYTPKAAHGAKC